MIMCMLFPISIVEHPGLEMLGSDSGKNRKLNFSHLFYIYINPKVLKKYIGNQGINFQFFSVCSALICNLNLTFAVKWFF